VAGEGGLEPGELVRPALAEAAVNRTAPVANGHAARNGAALPVGGGREAALPGAGPADPLAAAGQAAPPRAAATGPGGGAPGGPGVHGSVRQAGGARPAASPSP